MHYLILTTLWDVSIITISISQIGKWRLHEVRQLAQAIQEVVLAVEEKTECQLPPKK